MSKLNQILSFAVQQKASDILLMASSQPFIRLNGKLVAVQMPALPQAAIKHLLGELLDAKRSVTLQEQTNLDLSYEIPNVARFRVNCMMHRLGFGMVARIIPIEVPALETLGLPESVVGLLKTPNGLILVTGPSGCGKTTTQAAIIQKISTMKKDHILTVEDPIEFVIKSNQSLVNQREVHQHTQSFASALRAALREDPDIILIGEMRDRETISLALTAAETGHLVLGTLNTISAAATVDRIVDAFPGDQKNQVRMLLSGSLRSIVSQQLLRSKDGQSRFIAVEQLINTKSVSNLIREGKSFLIKNAMATGRASGMITMEESLAKLVKDEKVAAEEALKNCENPSELRKMLGMKEAPGATH